MYTLLVRLGFMSPKYEIYKRRSHGDYKIYGTITRMELFTKVLTSLIYSWSSMVNYSVQALISLTFNFAVMAFWQIDILI